MPHDRFFYSDHLEKDCIIFLSKEEDKHLRVMRPKPGQMVEVINGKGFLANAVLLDSGALEIKELLFETKRRPNIIIAQGIPRVNRLDLIVEKGTELGMDELWLFPGEMSEKQEISTTLLKRLENILVSAVKQCGRLWMPSISILPQLNKWNKPSESYELLFGDTDKNSKPFIASWEKNKDFIFFIGPEKGFSKKEETLLNTWNAKGIKLHDNILRTDTASLAFLSIINHLLLS